MSQTSYSQLSECGRDNIVDDVQPQSTERFTKWGVKILEAWLANRAIMCDFHSVSAEKLNTVLRWLYHVYGKLKKCQGDLFTSSALAGIRAAIHRYITSPPFNRSIDIIQDKEFMAANRMLCLGVCTFWRRFATHCFPTHQEECWFDATSMILDQQ